MVGNSPGCLGKHPVQLRGRYVPNTGSPCGNVARAPGRSAAGVGWSSHVSRVCVMRLVLQCQCKSTWAKDCYRLAFATSSNCRAWKSVELTVAASQAWMERVGGDGSYCGVHRMPRRGSLRGGLPAWNRDCDVALPSLMVRNLNQQSQAKIVYRRRT